MIKIIKEDEEIEYYAEQVNLFGFISGFEL